MRDFKTWCTLNKVDPNSISKAWDKLLSTAVSTKKQKSFNVTLPLIIGDQVWTSYVADVSNRDILFFCKEGTATYLVDSYGENHHAELFDWESSCDSEGV